MQESKKIFLDISFFIAFIDRADLNHIKCVSIFEFLASHEFRVFTSYLVILQTFNRAEKELGSTVAKEFLQAILESNIQILYPGKQELISAFRIIRANPTHQNSLTELLNAILMEKNGITAILTYDFWHNLLGTNKSQYLN